MPGEYPRRREPRAARRRIPGDADRDRLVPARPARARPSGAHRGAPRGRPRRPRVRARPAAARRRPLPVAQPGVVPAGEPARAARGAAGARRRAVRAQRPPRAGAAATLVEETGAEAVHFASDVSPFAMARDRRVDAAVPTVRHPGNFVADVGVPRTSDGRPFTVFSPFHRRWERPRAARGARRPAGADRAGRRWTPGEIPAAPEPEAADAVPARRGRGPRAAAPLARATASSATPTRHDRLAGGTSELSPYLHFGCLSARETEERARAKGGAAPTRSSASSRGATSTRTCCCTIPATRTRAYKPQFDELDLGRRRRRRSPRGARAAPASPSSTPACASCSSAAGCTTARG